MLLPSAILPYTLFPHFVPTLWALFFLFFKVLWCTGTTAALGADSTFIGNLEAGAAITVGANAFIDGDKTFTGEAAIDIGAGACVVGDITAAAAVTVGAAGTVEGVIVAGGATTVGAGGTVTGGPV